MKVDVFYNTGFDIVNIPCNPEMLYNQGFYHKEFDNVNLIQSDWLASITIEDDGSPAYDEEGWARDADYVVIYDEDVPTRTCYVVDHYEKLTDNCIKLYLILDPYNTAGGFEPVTIDGETHEPMLVRQGSANRLTVPLTPHETIFRQCEDNTFFTLEEPFQPAGRLISEFERLNPNPSPIVPEPEPGPTPVDYEGIMALMKTPYQSAWNMRRTRGVYENGIWGERANTGIAAMDELYATGGFGMQARIQPYGNSQSVNPVEEETVLDDLRIACIYGVTKFLSLTTEDALIRQYGTVIADMIFALIERRKLHINTIVPVANRTNCNIYVNYFDGTNTYYWKPTTSGWVKTAQQRGIYSGWSGPTIYLSVDIQDGLMGTNIYSNVVNILDLTNIINTGA